MIISVLIIVFVGLSYQLLLFLLNLMTSYRFEDNKIIKGRIKTADSVKGVNLIIDTVLVANMLAKAGDTSNVVAQNAAINWNNILNLIQLNMKHQFVEQYFDTELYEKTIYENPELIKTKKYSLVYKCDNKKKLVIPKIYEGICPTENKNGFPFIGRILIRATIVFMIAFIIAVLDLAIGFSKNTEYLSNISNTIENMEPEYTKYGYTLSGKTFSKEVGNGEKTSAVQYFIDKQGNVTGVDLQLYYNSECENLEDELTYIISTLNNEFSEYEVRYFINCVKENFSGNYKYGQIKSENFTLTIGKSSGYVDIHDY